MWIKSQGILSLIKTVSLSFDEAQTRDRDVARLQCTKDIQKLKEKKENKFNFSTLDRSPKSENSNVDIRMRRRKATTEKKYYSTRLTSGGAGREKNMNKRRSRNVVVAAFLFFARMWKTPSDSPDHSRAGALTNESVKSSSCCVNRRLFVLCVLEKPLISDYDSSVRGWIWGFWIFWIFYLIFSTAENGENW